MPSYIVKSGDSMSNIAARQGISLQELIAANPQIANPSLIHPGQSINIPKSDDNPINQETDQSWRSPSSEYVIQAGDCLSRIASIHGLSLDAVLSANPHITNPSLIHPGDRVVIPSGVKPDRALKQQLEKAGKEAQELGNVETDVTQVECASVGEATECVDADGFLTGDVAQRHHTGTAGQPNTLEHGKLEKINAIVLHRTAGGSAQSALNSFASTGIGAHFLIGKDGSILQTASLNQYAYHVGRIKARCEIEGNCEEADKKALDELGWAPKAIHDREKKKAYPSRYPINTDSVGIEVVGEHNASTGWAEATAEQKAAVRKLVERLKQCYSLGNDDIYEHDQISYKTAGEGAGLYDHYDETNASCAGVALCHDH